ncbi:hypothetical protein D3C75_1036560 [compost metagenome]
MTPGSSATASRVRLASGQPEQPWAVNSSTTTGWTEASRSRDGAAAPTPMIAATRKPLLIRPLAFMAAILALRSIRAAHKTVSGKNLTYSLASLACHPLAA